MALVALHQMGAAPDRLVAELDRHAREESEPRDYERVGAPALVAADGLDVLRRGPLPGRETIAERATDLTRARPPRGP